MDGLIVVYLKIHQIKRNDVMANLKRYEPVMHTLGCEYVEMEPAKNGEWVKFEDVEKLQRTIKQLKTEISAILCNHIRSQQHE